MHFEIITGETGDYIEFWLIDSFGRKKSKFVVYVSKDNMVVR